MVENAAARGEQLYRGALALQEKYDVIGDVRGGRGLMVALELVGDRTTKAPADKTTPAIVHETAYKAGAMIRVSGPNILMSPPLVLTSDDVQVLLNALDAGLSAL